MSDPADTGGEVPGAGSDLARAAPLPRSFYARDARVVAVELLNKVLVRADPGGVALAARIVETEAYLGPDDPASHAYRGETPRNATMFRGPGLLYVYFTYGMHWCANAVAGAPGDGVAVLLRAAAPLAGVEAMYRRRVAARRDRDLCSGPAKLCQAIGVDRSFDGADLVTADQGVTIVDDGTAPPSAPVVAPRVGISVAIEHPWRWYVAGDPNVSRR